MEEIGDCIKSYFDGAMGIKTKLEWSLGASNILFLDLGDGYTIVKLYVIYYKVKYF